MGWLKLDVILRRSSENSSESTIQTYMGASIKEQFGSVYGFNYINGQIEMGGTKLTTLDAIHLKPSYMFIFTIYI